MRMKAAILFEQGRPRPYAETRPLVVEEVELDPPGPGEILIEVAAAGLCHSDLSTIENQRPRPLPIVIGHEGAGIVRECGPGVTDLKPGDHVITVFASSCGTCRYCARGRPNICPSGNAARAAGSLVSGAKRIRRLDGSYVNHNSGLSLFAAVASGADRIIAVDTNPKKLEQAKEWGATDVFLAGNDDCAAAVRDATDGGLDTVIETAGTIPAMQLAIAITARGGSTISAGLPNVNASVSYLHASLVSEEKSIRGSYMGSCVAERDIPRLLSLYRRGKMPVNKLKSGVVKLEEINEGFDRLSDGTVLRQMLKPNG